MITIGLTGGIACGKSTVRKILASANIPVLDADQVAREAVGIGSSALELIVKEFGSRFLLENGTLNRKLLGAEIIRNKESKSKLEAITHPAIRMAIEEWIADRTREKHVAAAVEASLMVETGSHTNYDLVVVVSCEKEVQEQRLCRRNNISVADARAWIGSQLSIEKKEAVADIVIHNNGTLALLHDHVMSLIVSPIQAGTLMDGSKNDSR